MLAGAHFSYDRISIVADIPMTIAEAMRTATEHSCDMEWDAAEGLWRIGAISFDADGCALDSARLAAIDRATFIRDYIPDRAG
jgi:hypothetical protein